MKEFDVFALGNPLHDLQVQVSDAFLASLGAPKGGVSLIDREQYDALIPKLAGIPINGAAGGSAANTMIGIQLFGGTTCFTGKIGADSFGSDYRDSMTAKGVQTNLAIGESPTGLCVILITPDAQRTMFTYLGAGRELAPADVQTDILAKSRYLYVTGYLWDTDSQKQAVLYAMEQARKHQVPIAMSLSDPFCVHRHKADFQKIVTEHVDLLFGNQEEIEAFTDTKTPQDALAILMPLCSTVAITMSAQGSLIGHQGAVTSIDAFPVTAVDSTGAGDMYAAGLLYGLTHDLALAKTGLIASYGAAEVVSRLGPRLEKIDQEAIARLLA
jgi:sugar/nucleoside kinase (ribokinase family)